LQALAPVSIDVEVIRWKSLTPIPKTPKLKFELQYYRKMKRKHKFRNSDNSRKELKEAEKKYKKQMDTSIRKYRQKMKK
jgi:hypothetical protein